VEVFNADARSSAAASLQGFSEAALCVGDRNLTPHAEIAASFGADTAGALSNAAGNHSQSMMKQKRLKLVA
jgi:hypothetical protein